MGHYVESNLNAGEEVVHEGVVDKIIYAPAIMTAAFGATLTLMGLRQGGWALLLAVVMAVGAWIRQTTSEYVITNSRVIAKSGWLSRKAVEINLGRVESVQVEQDILGRLLDYGTIVVVGTGGTKETFTAIDDPMAFRQAMHAQQQA